MSASTVPDVAWLAACSMGLSCSLLRRERRIEMLGRAARWETEPLEAVLRALSDADVGDAATREAASELVRDTLVLARNRRHSALPPRRGAGASTGWPARR